MKKRSLEIDDASIIAAADEHPLLTDDPVRCLANPFDNLFRPATECRYNIDNPAPKLPPTALLLGGALDNLGETGASPGPLGPVAKVVGTNGPTSSVKLVSGIVDLVLSGLNLVGTFVEPCADLGHDVGNETLDIVQARHVQSSLDGRIAPVAIVIERGVDVDADLEAEQFGVEIKREQVGNLHRKADVYRCRTTENGEIA